MGNSLSILVHGHAKYGKSTFAATAPKPCLIIDAEGGTKFLPYRVVSWDPEKTPPPAADGTWDICSVTVRNFRSVTLTAQWLESGQHPFRSCVMDSISEVQTRLKDSIGAEIGGAAFQHAQWGSLLDGMDKAIRGIRDLTEHPTNPIEVVCFVSMTKEYNGRWKPYLQGQITDKLPYWTDLVGWLDVVEWPNPDPMQPPYQTRRLHITPNANYEAGERVQGKLGQFIDNPNLEQMLEQVYATPIATAAPQPTTPTT